MEEAIESFPCERCGKNFSYKYALKRHAKYCGDAVPETCRNCKKVLKNHSSLRTHERRCYGPDTEIPCLYCTKFFTNAYNFRRHIRTCHGNSDEIVLKTKKSKKSEVKLSTNVDEIKRLDSLKFEIMEQTENILENQVSEEIYTLQFGTELNDADVSVYKLAPSSGAVCDTIEIESCDDETDKSSEVQSYVFEYEHSSDEDVEQ